jgi:hypothetical protein
MTTLTVAHNASAGVAGSMPSDRGHAGQPGSGPEGATCAACAWSLRTDDDRGRRRIKCNLTDWDWLAASDIAAEDPACRYYDPRV